MKLLIFGKRALPAFLAIVMLFSVCFPVPVGAAACASSRVRKSTDFIALNDPLEAFGRLKSFGTQFAKPDSQSFPEDIIVANSNHIQGIARYGEYTVISVSGDPSISETGYFFFFDDEKLLGGFSSPEGTGSHLSDISIAGDYMACSGASGTMLFDLSPLQDGRLPEKAPVLITDRFSNIITIADYQGQPALFSILHNTVKAIPLPLTPASAESIADVAVIEDRTAPTPFGATYNWGVLGEWTNDNAALVTDTQGDLWLFMLNSRLILPGFVADLIGEAGMDYEDIALLYKVELKDDGTAVKTGPLASKKLKPFDSYLFALGSHFRFGASVQVLDANNFAVISSPSLPGNLAMKQIGETGKRLFDMISPASLRVNANVTRPQNKAFNALLERSPFDWLHEALSWMLTTIDFGGILGKLGLM
ncbi:MAG: hypothetical protein LBC83_07385 [Oscillospiraceae bacterium]|nr:hypothetical protein [Oscillospiraceae bacterium]